MKAKTIKAVIAKKMNEWWESIEDETVRDFAKANTIVTGGCIASMLLREKISDFDVYLRTKEAAAALAHYYVKKFHDDHNYQMAVEVTDERIRITTPTGKRGDTAGKVIDARNAEADALGEIEDTNDQTEMDAQENDAAGYKPVFISTNAITLSKKVQIVLRFFGEPEEIHKNYDFVHCTNYWSSWDGNLVLHKDALESLLSKELRYVGSKYPICSVFRLRKFIARQWTINAGQLLKMAMQISELDLKDLKVLEDQLTGVDVAYFVEIIGKLKEKDPEKVCSAYLVEILDRMF